VLHVLFQFDSERWIWPWDIAVVLIGIGFEATYSVGQLEVVQCPAEYASGAAGRILAPVFGP
jgi:hypothetical protein